MWDNGNGVRIPAGFRGYSGMRIWALAGVLGLCLAGCSTPQAENNDPLEGTNRWIFELNQKIDRHALRPTAERYVNNVPEGVRNGVHDVLANLDLPVTFANDLLQGEPKRAAQAAGRFLLNSTFGLAGVFDVAGESAGIEEHHEDFGQTLGVWGVGDGPYLVLPFLGPAPPRDAIGQAVDIGLDPTTYLSVRYGYWYLWIPAHKYAGLVDFRARNLENLDEIERDSLDYYATTRSLYRQYRASEIRNGRPPS